MVVGAGDGEVGIVEVVVIVVERLNGGGMIRSIALPIMVKTPRVTMQMTETVATTGMGDGEAILFNNRLIPRNPHIRLSNNTMEVMVDLAVAGL